MFEKWKSQNAENERIVIFDVWKMQMGGGKNDNKNGF